MQTSGHQDVTCHRVVNPQDKSTCGRIPSSICSGYDCKMSQHANLKPPFIRTCWTTWSVISMFIRRNIAKVCLVLYLCNMYVRGTCRLILEGWDIFKHTKYISFSLASLFLGFWLLYLHWEVPYVWEQYRFDTNTNRPDICEHFLNPAERSDEDPFQANSANTPISVTFYSLLRFPACLTFFFQSSLCSPLLIPFISASGLPTYLAKVRYPLLFLIIFFLSELLFLCLPA